MRRLHFPSLLICLCLALAVVAVATGATNNATGTSTAINGPPDKATLHYHHSR